METWIYGGTFNTCCFISYLSSYVHKLKIATTKYFNLDSFKGVVCFLSSFSQLGESIITFHKDRGNMLKYLGWLLKMELFWV